MAKHEQQAVAEQVEQAVVQQVEAVSRWIDTLIEFGVTYGFQILGALVFLFIGLKASAWAGRKVAAILDAKDIDPTLGRFIGNIIRVVMIVFLIIITLGNFGISIAPLIALAGAAAFGATMAIQGPLSNYGAGLSIIMARPFAVGDTITVNRQVSGVVADITLAYTILTGEDGERITIPNKEIVGRVIVNSKKNRVVQTKICIGDDQDADQAIGVLKSALEAIADLQDGPSIQVGIHDFTYGGIVLGLRFWVPSQRYFQVRYAVNGVALAALKSAGIGLLDAGSVAVVGASLSGDEEEEEETIFK
jgi:small conductance mechanosensitive channel